MKQRLALIDAGVDESLKDFVGNTEQRVITFYVLYKVHRLWNHDYRGSSQDFGNYESAQPEREKLMYPNFKAASA